MTPYLWQQGHVAGLTAAIRAHGCAASTSGTGSGKTICALAVAKSLGRKAAICCPKSVIPHWLSTAERMGVEIEFCLNYEKLRTGRTPYGSWAIKKRVFNWSVQFGNEPLLCLDEAHRTKGMSSQNSKMLVAARRQRIPTLLLSATLCQSPLEMNAIGFALGLHSRGRDFIRFCKENGVRKGYFGLEFTGGADAMENIRDQMGDRIQAIPQAVLDEKLPDNRIYTRMVPSEKNPDCEYEKDLREAEEGAENPLTATLRSRQLAELWKSPALVEMTRDAQAEGSSVVVFASFRETGDRLASALGCAFLCGENSAAERETAIADFQADKTHAIIVQTQLGVGISLHDIRGERPRLSLISPSYSALDLIQALGRIHRAGGKSPATQNIVFAHGSDVERRIERAIEAKLNNLSALTDSDLGIG